MLCTNMFHATHISFLHVCVFKMLVLRRKTCGKSSGNLVQHVGECGIAETVLGCWVLCSLTAKALELLISPLFASDSESEAINSERQKKEVGGRFRAACQKGEKEKRASAAEWTCNKGHLRRL